MVGDVSALSFSCKAAQLIVLTYVILVHIKYLCSTISTEMKYDHVHSVLIYFRFWSCSREVRLDFEHIKEKQIFVCGISYVLGKVRPEGRTAKLNTLGEGGGTA